MLRSLGCVSTESAVGVVRVDVNAVSFCLEEAMSNANKYRATQSPIVAQAQMEGDGAWLHIQVTNQNQPGVPPMSEAECARSLQHGRSGANGRHTPYMPSDGLGLDSACTVVGAVGGSVWLEAAWQGDVGVTSFHVRLPAEHIVSPAIVVAAPSEPSAYGSGGDGSPGQSSFKAPRQSALAGLDAGLVCIGIDDDPFMHVIHSQIFGAIGADEQNSRSFDETVDREAFVDVVMGRLDAELMRPVKRRRADVVFLDMNISEALNGLDLAARLHAEAFGGLVCLLTASDPSEVDVWRDRPGVDLIVEKGTAIATVQEQVLEALARRLACSSRS